MNEQGDGPDDGEGEAHGRGFTAASRAPRAALASGVACLPTEWTPHSYQAPLLAIDKGIILAVGALGSGKSEPGAEALLRWALRHPRRADGRPTKWYVIGPDYSLIRQEQFGKLLEHARKIKLEGGSIVKRVVMGIDPRIVLLHDQVIIGRSATDPDRLRGHEVDGFWGDEVQEWPERAFRIALSRTRSASATRVVLTGSPEDSPGWVWHLVSGKHRGYDKMREELKKSGSGFYAFRWSSSQNTANQEGVLGTIRSAMEASAAGVAAQELDGRFPGTHESPTMMGEIDYGPAFAQEHVELEGAQAIGQSIGVDIGESRDWTWITVMSRGGVVLYMERFNVSTPGVPRRGFFPYLERRVVHLARTWRAETVVVDIAKAGAGVAQHLAIELGARARVIGYDTGAGHRKADAIEIVGTAMSRGDVLIPISWTVGGKRTDVQWIDHLKKELAEIAPKDVGKGRRRWDHPQGGHDDGVVSVSLAYHGLTAPRVAGTFRAEWVRRYKIDGAELRLVAREGEAVDDRRFSARALVRYVTVALPSAEEPDCAALMALGADPFQRVLVVLEVVRAQLTAPEIVPAIRSMVSRWQAPPVFLRRADLGTASSLTVTWAAAPVVTAEAKRQGLDVREIAVDPDRVNRALVAAAALQSGVCRLQDGAEWLVELERELLEFPGGPNGAQVDALSCAVHVFNDLVAAASQRDQAPQKIKMR